MLNAIGWDTVLITNVTIIQESCIICLVKKTVMAIIKKIINQVKELIVNGFMEN